MGGIFIGNSRFPKQQVAIFMSESENLRDIKILRLVDHDCRCACDFVKREALAIAKRKFLLKHDDPARLQKRAPTSKCFMGWPRQLLLWRNSQPLAFPFARNVGSFVHGDEW